MIDKEKYHGLKLCANYLEKATVILQEIGENELCGECQDMIARMYGRVGDE